jgi:hypothetical protein
VAAHEPVYHLAPDIIPNTTADIFPNTGCCPAPGRTIPDRTSVTTPDYFSNVQAESGSIQVPNPFTLSSTHPPTVSIASPFANQLSFRVERLFGAGFTVYSLGGPRLL